MYSQMISDDRLEEVREGRVLPDSASCVSSLTFLIFVRPTSVWRLATDSLNIFSRAMRESSGMPLLYCERIRDVSRMFCLNQPQCDDLPCLSRGRWQVETIE